MKFILVIFIPAAFIAAACYSAYNNLHSHMNDMLASYGFEKTSIGAVHYQNSHVIYSDISLDENEFSTISDIQIPAGYLDIFLHKRPKTIIINDIRLTGSFDREVGLDISGWDKTPLPYTATERITLNGGRLDLMTAEGALRFEAKGEITQNEQGNLELQAALWTVQNQLEMQTAWKGVIYPNGRWVYDIDIREANIRFDNIQASRMSGWLNIDKSKGLIPAVSGQLDAGKLTLGKINLMNVRLTANGPLNQYKLIGSGKIGGFTDMAFVLEINNKAEGPYVEATIDTASLEDLITFLGQLGSGETTGNLTSLLLTPGNLERLRGNLKKLTYDTLELQIYGSLYDLTGKVTAKRYKDGVTQRQVISLDPGVGQ